jgi:hypothetical protein
MGGMSTDTARTAHNPAAPADERREATAELQQAHMPTASDLIPRGDLVPLIDFIQDQYAEQDLRLAKSAQVIEFPGRPRDKDGMQSVRLDRLQAMAYGDYYERPGLASDALRAMVEQTPVLNAVIMTRIRQVQRFCNPQDADTGPGFQIAHVDPDHEVTPSERASQHLLSRFLTNCGWEFNPRRRKAMRRDNFAGLMAKVVRESLTYDALAIETEARNDGRGINGLYALDGSTIRLCPEDGYRGDDSKFAVQVVTGQVVTAYGYEDLIFEPRNPRADVRLAGYGMGETELLVRVVTGFLNAMTHNSKGFDDNSIPRGLLQLTGEYDERDLMAFKRQWNAMVTGVNNAWKLPVLTSRTAESKAEFTQFGQGFDEMHFSKWMTFLVSIICAIYGMSPAEINFDSFTAGNTSALAGNDTAEKLAASKDSGLRPLMAYLESVVSDFIVTDFSDKYCFRWTGLEPEDAQQKSEIRKLVLTVNEMRAQENYDKLDGPLGDAPLNPSLIGPWMQLTQQAQGGQEGGDDGQDQDPGQGGQDGPDGGQDGGEQGRPQGRDQADAGKGPKDAGKGKGGDAKPGADDDAKPGEWEQLARGGPQEPEDGEQPERMRKAMAAWVVEA